MAPLFYLFNTILTFCIYIVILRLWMHLFRVNYYNPLTQLVIKLTQPIIEPLSKIIPSIKTFETSAWLLLYILALIKFYIIINNLPANLPSFRIAYLLYAIYIIIHAIGQLLFWILAVRAIFSWLNRSQSLIEVVLYQLTEPLIAPIRRVVPPIGNIDLSFLIFVFLLFVLNSLAMQFLTPWWGLAAV